MPVVTIENAGELSRETKEALIRKVTDVISEITGKPESSVYTKIIEVPRENFGVGGSPLG